MKGAKRLGSTVFFVTILVMLAPPLVDGFEKAGSMASEAEAAESSGGSFLVPASEVPAPGSGPEVIHGHLYPRPIGEEGTKDYDFATGCCVDGNSTCNDDC